MRAHVVAARVQLLPAGVISLPVGYPPLAFLSIIARESFEGGMLTDLTLLGRARIRTGGDGYDHGPAPERPGETCPDPAWRVKRGKSAGLTGTSTRSGRNEN